MVFDVVPTDDQDPEAGGEQLVDHPVDVSVCCALASGRFRVFVILGKVHVEKVHHNVVRLAQPQEIVNPASEILFQPIIKSRQSYNNFHSGLDSGIRKEKRRIEPNFL